MLNMLWWFFWYAAKYIFYIVVAIAGIMIGKKLSKKKA